MSRLVTLALTEEEAAFFFAFTTTGLIDVTKSYMLNKKQGTLPPGSEDFEQKRARVIELMAEAMASAIDLEK
jgi:hypothetical protein